MAEAPTLVTRVSKAAHEAFIAYCLRHSSTPAEQLRQLVSEALAHDQVTDVEIAPRGIGRGNLRIELRLTSDEKRLLAQLTKSDGVSPQQWFIARLLDSGMKKENRFIDTTEARQLAGEIERIMRSLLGIATNLNQVARALNSSRNSAPEISQPVGPERLLVLSVIERDLMAFVHRAHAVLEKLDNPRGLKPLPKKNQVPITPELCNQIREKLDEIARTKIVKRS